MRLFIVCVFSCLIFATAASAQSADILRQLRDGDSPRVLVAAHRGAHAAAPENSLTAIEAAIALGVDIVEIDIRLTRDGVPILMHDATVDRTTDGTGAVVDLSFEQLRKLRLRDGTDRPTAHLVPTLTEALAAADGRIMLDLDLKTDDIDPILGRVVEAEMLDHALFFNGDAKQLSLFRKGNPDVLLMPRARSLQSTSEASAAFSPEVIHIDPSFNDAPTLEAARKSDSRLWINALGDPDRLVAEGRPADGLEPLLAHGASIVQTDHPAAVLLYFQTTGRRRPT